MSSSSANPSSLAFIPFVPSHELQSFENTPRFGKPDDIAILLEDNADDKQEYIVGLVASGFFALTVFIVWALVLLIFMCCGQNRVGFLSGRPFERTISPIEEEESLRQRKRQALKEAGHDEEDEEYDEQWREETLKQERERRAATYSCKGCCGGRPTRVRIWFLISSFVFVLFSVLMVTQGITQLNRTLYSMDDTAVQIYNISKTAMILMEDVKERVGGVAKELQVKLRDELQDQSFCPNAPALDNSDIGNEIKSKGNMAVDALDKLNTFLGETATQVNQALYEANDYSQKISGYIRQVQTDDWKALLVLIPYMVVPVLLMTGTVMALYEVNVPYYSCLLNWVIMPLFIILVSIAWIWASIMLIMGGVEGDFCLPGGRVENEQIVANFPFPVNSPDISVFRMMQAAGLQGQEVEKIVTYYVAQCQSENDPFQFIRDEIPTMEDGQAKVGQLTALLEDSSTINDLSLYCNRDFNTFEALAFDLSGVIRTLLSAVNHALNLVSCDRVVPLYAGFAYDGVCTYSASAVAWIFACTFTMGVSGMVMISLRASYKMTTYHLGKYESNVDVDADETRDTINLDEKTVRGDLHLQESGGSGRNPSYYDKPGGKPVARYQ